MLQENQRETTRQKIISATKAEMTSIGRFLSKLTVTPTTVDFCMDSKENLPDEMVFEEGGIPKIIMSIVVLGFLTFIACASFTGANEFTVDDAIPFVIYSMVFFCLVLYFILRPMARDKIVISKKGITLSNCEITTWETIEDTYIKEIIGGKTEKFFFIVTLKNGTHKEQQFSNSFGSKNKNLGHYTELYKRSYST